MKTHDPRLQPRPHILRLVTTARCADRCGDDWGDIRVTYTKGPWAISWFTCRADADDVKYAATPKLRKGEPRKKLDIGDALWRVPTAIGPVGIDHCHWAGHHLAVSENDTRLIAAAPEMVEVLRGVLSWWPEGSEKLPALTKGTAFEGDIQRARALLAKIDGDEA
jgi:hypothetical protein